VKKAAYFFCTFLFCFSIIACAGSYAKKIRAIEEAFYIGDIDTAVQQITPIAQDATSRDRLLYYMEAGIIYREKGDLKTSNEILLRAAQMADEIQTSVTDSTKAFFLGDPEKEFQGENFERALIRYYLALNQAMLGELVEAKRTLRKLDADLKDMKYDDAPYKQILVARYLDALISEELGEFNDARVQYKNLENFGVDRTWLARERYILAEKSHDAKDKKAYSFAKPKPIDFPNAEGVSKTGELVLFCETGKAAVKASRGKLMNDQEFVLALRAAIEIAIISEGKALSAASVIAMLGTAENPIAEFKERETLPVPNFFVNGVSLSPLLTLTNFDTMAQKNYNDNYSSYINKNVASLATKIVLGVVAAQALSNSLSNNSKNDLVGVLGSFAIGVGTGAAIAATIKPDLRSWHTLPVEFAVLRVKLPVGKYQLRPDLPLENLVSYGSDTEEVVISEGKKTVVSLRLFKRGL